MEDLDPRLRGDGKSTSGQDVALHQHDAGGVSHLRTSDASDASRRGLGIASYQRHAAQQPTVDDAQSNKRGATDNATSVSSGTSPALDEEAKKARACEACRGLKVRCEPDPDDETQPCKRCKKAGRNCVVTAPSRKRQKKTDSRVADLEKKIDALTATLQARSNGGSIQTSAAQAPMTRRDTSAGEEEHSARDASNGRAGIPSARTWHSSTMYPAQDNERQSPSIAPRRTASIGATPPTTFAGQKRKDRHGLGSPEQPSDRMRQPKAQYPPTSYKSRNPDFLERGLITPEQADQLLERYIEHMCPQFPAMLVPTGMKAMELSKTRPMLFSSIMAAATSTQPDLQRTLQKELMTCFAEKVFLAGEKSFDTVQAILVAVVWYWPPENFEELKFYQLIHVASVMAIDLGLGRRNGSKRAEVPAGLRDPTFKKPPLPDALSLESRRTWLTCYILGTNAAMALHRPVLVRWTSFMAESVELLENSPDALPSDRNLAQMVLAHKLSEESGIHFFSEDPDIHISLANPATQYVLRGLEMELERHKAKVPQEEQIATVSMTFDSVSIFMHELVLSNSIPGGSERPPFSTEALTVSIISSDQPPTGAQISALSVCLVAIHHCFDVFLAMPVDASRSLPVYFFVRIAYALVILIKIAFSAAAPGSELGKVIGPDDMKLQFYMDSLLRKFRETSADEKCRPAAKFLIVLAMLRTWVVRQMKDGTIPISSSMPGNAEHATRTSQHQKSQPEDPKLNPPLPRASPTQQTPNTPLHLLSEVASNRNTSTSTGGGGGGPIPTFFPGMRVPQPFFADDSTTSAVAPTVSTPSTTSVSAGPAPDMNLQNWMQSGTGFAPAMPLDPTIMNGVLDIENMDMEMAEPWFTDMLNVMPNMENIFYF